MTTKERSVQVVSIPETGLLSHELSLASFYLIAGTQLSFSFLITCFQFCLFVSCSIHGLSHKEGRHRITEPQNPLRVTGWPHLAGTKGVPQVGLTGLRPMPGESSQRAVRLSLASYTACSLLAVSTNSSLEAGGSWGGD